MWQFAESVRGMGDACRALGTPVTGGNVSFYNEAGGSAIWPTPVIGMLGLIDDYRLMLRPAFTISGRVVYVVGETIAELGGSEFAEVVLGRVSGHPPALDLAREAALHRLLVEGAKRDAIGSAHDCGDGGLAVALAECAMAGGTGFAVTLPGDAPWYVTLFSESASRAVISVDAAKVESLERLASELSVPATRIGETGGPRMVFDSVFETTVEEAAAVYDGALPGLLAG
jgi:phosphoribosylformylglycinamidine synthase